MNNRLRQRATLATPAFAEFQRHWNNPLRNEYLDDIDRAKEFFGRAYSFQVGHAERLYAMLQATMLRFPDEEKLTECFQTLQVLLEKLRIHRNRFIVQIRVPHRQPVLQNLEQGYAYQLNRIVQMEQELTLLETQPEAYRQLAKVYVAQDIHGATSVERLFGEAVDNNRQIDPRRKTEEQAQILLRSLMALDRKLDDPEYLETFAV
jgi:hypothetical protein